MPPETTNDTFHSPQAVVGTVAMVIVAATVAAVFWKGDNSTQNLVVGAVMGYGGAVLSYYFGWAKDAVAPPRKE